MLKKPDFIPQAQENTQNPTNTLVEAQAIDEGRMESSEIKGNIIPSESPQLQPISKEEVVYKKREFKAFKKLIKEGKYTSAVVSSRLLGVDKGTILKWMHMPSVLNLQQSEVNEYISDIAHSKDWKAKAYLLDKLEGQDKTEQQSINLTNLIQINTVSPSQE